MKRRLPWLLLVVLGVGALLVRQGWRRAIGHGTGTVIAALHGMGVAGLFLLAGAEFLVAASGILPASLLGIAAGAAYGLVLGFATAAGGVLLGAVVAFFLSRSMFRPFVARQVEKSRRLARIDRALARDGWRFVFMLRLSPIMPFALASYTLGLSSVGFGAYSLGTLASLPALMLYVFMGTVAKTGAESLAAGAGIMQWILLSAGGLATLALSWRIGRIALQATEAVGADDNNPAG